MIGKKKYLNKWGCSCKVKFGKGSCKEKRSFSFRKVGEKAL